MALGAVTATQPFAAQWAPGQQFTSYGYYTIGAAVAAADTITFTSIIPAGGCRIISTRLMTPKIDTHATPTATWDLGDADDADRLINDVAGGWDDEATYAMYDSNVTPAATVGVGYTYTTAKSLVLTVTGTMATAASTGHVALWVTYYCVGNV